jgi:hypothetical protein
MRPRGDVDSLIGTGTKARACHEKLLHDPIQTFENRIVFCEMTDKESAAPRESRWGESVRY